jgi:hypothetical protein
MAIRLLQWPTNSIPDWVAQKVILAITFISLIFIFVNFWYICKLRKKSDIIRLSVIYVLGLLECIAVIFHYGFLPRRNNAINYIAVSQEGLKFTYYFFVIFILFKSSIKLTYVNKLPKKYIALLVIFVLNAAYILWILLVAFIRGPSNPRKFCTDHVWVLLRISHLASFFLLLVSSKLWWNWFQHPVQILVLILILRSSGYLSPDRSFQNWTENMRAISYRRTMICSNCGSSLQLMGLKQCHIFD